ncbi:MAG: hypothetical protein HC802_17030 [Caldilineaceae bacterium]|nr:hypothetical protein [Caldilineaceae bacterium]
MVSGNDVAVVDGLFTVALDFGNVFDGRALWLEIKVRPGASSGGYTLLAPRQALLATPYALNNGLPQSCATNQIIRWNGTNWVCTVDQSAALEARVAALEALLTHVSRSGNELTISGANLHVVNGLNDTETSNGLGNVIIGYNEERESGVNDHSGSHVLAVGSQNNYSGYGGIVVGEFNFISGSYASVTAGYGNIASGEYASVSGGGF